MSCGGPIEPIEQFVNRNTQVASGPHGKTFIRPSHIEQLTIPAPKLVSTASPARGASKAFGSLVLVILTLGIWLIIEGICAIIVLVVNGAVVAANTKQTLRYRATMQRWRTLLICSQCGHVFDPQIGQTITPDQVRRHVTPGTA
jgi:hypothetical protein